MTQSPYETGEYLTHNPDWHAEDSPFKAQWIADILKRNHVAPDHIVEVGTGSGEILVQLRQCFPDARLEGYDISPQAYAIAAPKAADGLTFHHADYLTTGGPAPDVLMAIDVFEHVEDYMAFLRAMKPRAPLKLFHIPLDLSVQGVLRGKPILAARQMIGHLHYFTKDTALAVLADCGYEVIDWNYTHGAETLPHRAVRTKVLNVPRRMLRSVNEDFAVRLMGGASIMVLTR
jgi:cyclopropane fatty-acyl-phospholipid synthase-like methyltransferase